MQFKPAGETAQEPEGTLASQIEKQWGSVDAFKAEFEAKGVGLFGSGWVWLSADADGNLVITQEQGASGSMRTTWITRTAVLLILQHFGRLWTGG